MLALLFHLAGALWIALAVPFPAHIDELQHLSYIEDMAEHPVLFPRFQAMRVLDRDGRNFTQERNYLNHPSLYYHLMASVPVTDRSPKARIRALRLLNVALSAAGVMLMLWGGLVLLPSPAAFAAFAALLVMFPKLAVVGGLINNDNLSVFATGLCFAGLARLHRGGGLMSGALLGLGLALAGWGKLTVLIMAGLAVLAAEALRLGAAPDRRHWFGLGAAGIGGLVAIVPTVENYLAYGAPLFISVESGHNFVPVAERPDLGFLGHGLFFLYNMALKWPALEPAGAAQLAGLSLVVAAVAVSVATWIRDRWYRGGTLLVPTAENAARLLAVAYGASAVATLGIHMLFGWQMFREMGDLTSAQPRYYYAVWPGIALACALAVERLPAGRWRLYGGLGLAILAALSTIQLAALSAALTGTPLAPS